MSRPTIHIAFIFADDTQYITRLITVVTTEQHMTYVAGSGKRAGTKGLLATEADQTATQAAADRCDPTSAPISLPMHSWCIICTHRLIAA